MKYYFLLLIVAGVLFTSHTVNAQAQYTCQKAVLSEVCTTQGEVVCGVADEICPVLYGEWDKCIPNGGSYKSKCNTCDVDCINKETLVGGGLLSTCGDIFFKNFPYYSVPGESHIIRVEAIQKPAGTDISLRRMQPDNPPANFGSLQCSSQPCEVRFDNMVNSGIKAPGQPGVQYCYEAYVSAQPGTRKTECGMTTPAVDVSIVGNPLQVNVVVTGQTQIQAITESNIGITLTEFFLEKEITPGSFRKVNKECIICTGDCNLMGNVDHSSENPKPKTTTDIIPWNTQLCENGNYRITGITSQEGGGTGQDTITVITDNAGCSGPSCLFISDVVQIIRTRVKTWF